MRDGRDEVAARNNAQWCAAVWRSHDLPAERKLGLWFCRRSTPEYYPNVVAVERAASAAEQTAVIAGLCRDRPELDFSVKDSFAGLDLDKAGLTPLFEARWLWRENHAARPVEEGLLWRQIGDEQGLADWELAWREGRAGPRIFRPGLLSDRRSVVLAGFDDAGRILAGGIGYRAAGVVGITNIFGSREQFVAALAARLPAQPLVGYEYGENLRSAQADGFQALGRLRVWTRRV